MGLNIPTYYPLNHREYQATAKVRVKAGVTAKAGKAATASKATKAKQAGSVRKSKDAPGGQPPL